MKKTLIYAIILCLYSISSPAVNTNDDKEKLIKAFRDNHYFLQADNILPDNIIASLKARISEILKPKDIKKTSSGCSNSYSSQCERINNPFIYGSPSNQISIKTPHDVYCFSKKQCCDTYKNTVNSENFCECYAQHHRKLSYNWQHIDNTAVLKLSFFDGACKNEKSALDWHMNINAVYDKVFSLCVSEISDTAYCDKLAQTTKYLIHSELIEQKLVQKTELDSAMFFYFLQMGSYNLSNSSYNDIINSNEFQTLLKRKY